MLDYLELPSTETPRILMLWLHGLGADGYDLEPAAEMLGLKGVRHVFPHAPVRPVTINGGMAMRAWYDIAGPDLQWREDAEGMRASALQVHELAEELRKNSDLPVVLAGFSQGAVISLVAAALGMRNLIGVVSMSGYIPRFLSPSLAALQGVPVLMMHGEQDEVIPFAMGKSSGEMLGELGVALAWRSYAMPHTICQQEIQDLAKWLLSFPGLNPGA